MSDYCVVCDSYVETGVQCEVRIFYIKSIFFPVYKAISYIFPNRNHEV